MRLNLKLFRVAQCLTQAEMAYKMGCSRMTYNRIENGESEGKEYNWNELKREFNLKEYEINKLKHKERRLKNA